MAKKEKTSVLVFDSKASNIGRHSKKDTPNKGSKNYKKPYNGQGR